ncbi:MAG: RNA pseudouridine synthase [Rhodocyclales bacterium]|nr:RNA pseudouridine synthase [Rhodocyclales bacterium]
MVKTSHQYPPDYSPSPAPARGLEVPAACAGWRLDATLAKLFPEHSRSRLQGWLKQELILLDGAAAEGKRKVYGGERIQFDAAAVTCPRSGIPGTQGAPAPTLESAAEDIALNVVFEDEHLIVIDKPAGLVVHPGNGNASGTMLNGLLHHAPQLAGIPRAGIVHRLDKDTSGLLVVAKTLTAQTDLVRQMQARTVKKSTLLECRLETGRTHQIRVHLASIKHPLAGDAVYGKSRSGDARLDAFPRQALHAWRLALIHPASGVEMAWEAPLPEDFANLLAALRG